MPVYSTELLSPASWREIPFLIDLVGNRGGQKTVVHNYPGSNRRTVENLGTYPEEYEVEAIVTGAEYFTTRRLLRDALREGGIGEFVHPWDGAVKCAVDGQYEFTETDAELGVTVFKFKLVVSEELFLPLASGSAFSEVDLLANYALDLFGISLGNEFSVSDSFPSNFEKAKKTLEEVGDFFDEKRKVFKQASDQISETVRTIDNFKSDVVELISAPAQLGTDVIGLYQSVVRLYEEPIERFEAMKQFFSFGEYQDFTPTTAANFESKKNNNAIVSTMAAASLTEAYRAASAIEYENIDNLDKAQSELESQYQVISSNIKDDNQSGLSDEAIEALDELRDTVRKFLDEKRPTVAQIVSVRTNTIPAAVLSFQYYGDSSKTDQIIRLNGLRDVSFVDGDVDILSA